MSTEQQNPNKRRLEDTGFGNDFMSLPSLGVFEPPRKQQRMDNNPQEQHPVPPVLPQTEQLMSLPPITAPAVYTSKRPLFYITEMAKFSTDQVQGAMRKTVDPETQAQYGPVGDIKVGTTFATMQEVLASKIHTSPSQRVCRSGEPSKPSTSLILYDGEPHDDCGYVILFVGEPAELDPQASVPNTPVLAGNNLSMSQNCALTIPIRVIRAANPSPQSTFKTNKHTPQSGFRYDGVFFVSEYWPEQFNSQWVYIFKLLLVYGQPSVATDVGTFRSRKEFAMDETFAPSSRLRTQVFFPPQNIQPQPYPNKPTDVSSNVFSDFGNIYTFPDKPATPPYRFPPSSTNTVNDVYSGGFFTGPRTQQQLTSPLYPPVPTTTSMNNTTASPPIQDNNPSPTPTSNIRSMYTHDRVREMLQAVRQKNQTHVSRIREYNEQIDAIESKVYVQAMDSRISSLAPNQSVTSRNKSFYWKTNLAEVPNTQQMYPAASSSSSRTGRAKAKSKATKRTGNTNDGES